MKLYDHQKKIIDEDPKKTGLWLGTGSGKTRIALALARGSVLVICPKTQKEDGNWEREYTTMRGIDPFIPIPGTTTSTIYSPNNMLHVISKETFRRDHAILPRFGTVIVDEAHTCLGVTPNTRYRNKKEIPKASQLFEALDEYLMRTKPERLYLCTATIMKSPMTVWAAVKLLSGSDAMVMAHFFAFRNEFYTRLPMPGREVWVPKSDTKSKTELASIVKDIGYTGRLQDFFDVPDQTFKTEHIELTQKQKDRIKQLVLEYPEQIVRVGKRHQVENGVLSGDEFSTGEQFDNGKIDRIIDYASEFPRMVVFAKYRAQIDAIGSELRRRSYKVLTLTGDTKDRGHVIDEAKASEQCVFIAQAQISAGWELPDFPVMIFASMTYSLVDRLQSEGRILRANALKKNLYITLIVKGGIDEAVFRSISNKQDFHERQFIEQAHGRINL